MWFFPYIVDFLKLIFILLGVCVYTTAEPVAQYLNMFHVTDLYTKCA